MQGSQYMQGRETAMESPDGNASKIVISFQDVPLSGSSINVSPPQTSQMLRGNRYDLSAGNNGIS